MNDNDSAKPGSDGPRKDEALAWNIRMRGEVSEQLQEQFEQWLAASPRHRQAYNRYSRVIAQAEILKSSGQTDEATTAKLRSEEHTSELQSLMRISYAVFCLKKKKKT